MPTEGFLLEADVVAENAFFRACGETTRPSGWTKPIQSW